MPQAEAYIQYWKGEERDRYCSGGSLNKQAAIDILQKLQKT